MQNNDEFKLLEALVENLPIAVFLKDVRDQFKVTLWNRGAETIFGIPREKIIGKSAHDLWPKEQADLYLAADQEVVQRGQHVDIAEEPSESPNRGRIYLHTQKLPLRLGDDQSFRYLLCICEDITTRRSNDRVLIGVMDQLEEAQRVAKIGSWSLDLRTGEQYWSHEHYRIFEIPEGQDPAQLYALYRSKIHPDDVARLDSAVEDAKRDGKGIFYDHRVLFPDGRLKYVQGIGEVTRDSDGAPLRLSGTCQDVSELRAREARFKVIVETMNEGFVLQDQKGVIRQYNTAALSLLGLTDDQLLGRTSMDAAWQAVREDGSALMGSEHPAMLALKTGERQTGVVMGLQLPSGARRWISINATPYDSAAFSPDLRGSGDRHVVCTFSDITKLIESKNYLKSVLDSVGRGVWGLDRSGKVTFINHAAVKQLGYSSAETIVGQDMHELSHHSYADGSKYPAEQCPIRRASKDGSAHYIEREVLWRKDGTHFPVSYYASPILSGHECVGSVLSFEDLTQKLRLERELESERLKVIQSARLASLGEMSAGVAHEINNPLAVISGSLGLLDRYRDDPQKFKEKLAAMQKAIDRIAKIVSGLKKFSRHSDASIRERKVLADIITESLFMTESKARRIGVGIQLDLRSRASISCDEVEIEQVVVNLVNNALDAVVGQPGAWVRIEVEEEQQSLRLRVRDSGKGIAQAVEEKLFQPFFTTKPVGEGTGLGLSIVKGILDQHEATIAVRRDDPNTCFEIRFRKV